MSNIWLVRGPGTPEQRFSCLDTAKIAAQQLANDNQCAVNLVQLIEQVIGTFYPGEELLIPAPRPTSRDCEHET